MNEAIAEILCLFSDALGERIKTFYHGEVNPVPKTYCPALMVYPVTSSINAKTTSSDNEESFVRVRIVDILMNYLTEGGQKETIEHQYELADMMQGRDADGKYKADSVAGVLRKRANIRGENYIFNDNIEVSYSVIQQGEFFYVKAEATFSFYDIVQRS